MSPFALRTKRWTKKEDLGMVADFRWVLAGAALVIAVAPSLQARATLITDTFPQRETAPPCSAADRWLATLSPAT